MADTTEDLAEKIARLEELNRDLMGMIENSYDASPSLTAREGICT